MNVWTTTTALLACCGALLANDLHGQTLNSTDDPSQLMLEQVWAQWRGPDGTGASDVATPPTRWSETENVRWKVELPGLGHSSPIVWGQHVIVTTAIPFGEKFDPIADNAPGSHDNLKVSQQFKFAVMAFDRADGNIRWQQTLHEAIPHEGGHVSGSLASASPVTDGQHIVVSFGSYGVYCLDFEGAVVWKKSLGKMHSKHAHGEGASPALCGNVAVINWDHERQSFIVALDKTTGEELWRADRQEVTSWASPVICKHAGRAQVIVAGTGAVRGYDLQTGDVIWSCSGLSNNVVATPIVDEGVVFVGSSYEIKSMFAIKLAGAHGDITGTENVLWQRASRTPYVPSPLLYRGSLYFLRHYQGILTVLDAATGKESVGPFRLRGLRDIYSSPIAADGKIFITDRGGTTVVLSYADLPRVLSINRLDDSFSASSAMVGGELFLRGERYLYCIANADEQNR